MIIRRIFRKIFPAKTEFDFPGGYIPHRFFTERIKEGPVLIVGDFSGREYRSIKENIKETYLVDIVDNDIASGKYFFHQSIENPVPVSPNFFKSVLVSEVLEFVWEDEKALREIWKVTDDGGYLFWGVPFWNDCGQWHYHIYSPKTAKAILEHSGFEIIEESFRGLALSTPDPIVALMALIIYPVWGKRSLEKANYFLYKLQILLGRFSMFNSFFKFFGAYIVARKKLLIADPVERQRVKYQKTDKSG